MGMKCMTADRLRRHGWRYALWLLGGVALWLALRSVPLAEIRAVLARLGWGGLVALVLLNLLVLLSLSGRWWAILRAHGQRAPYLMITAFRWAGFAVSYFTPGPQFGGEPLQALLLQRRRGVPPVTAAASLVLDKSLELIANFAFLVAAVVLALKLGLIPAGARVAAVGLALALLALPIGYLAVASAGRRPFTWLLARAPRGVGPGSERLRDAVAAGEAQVSALLRSGAGGLAAATAFSALSWAGLVIEYWAMARFLGLPLTLEAAMAALALARLAILLPLPGGLGVLEASQVWALSALGFTAAEGAGLGLLIRARDIAIASAGLWLGGWSLGGGQRG
jgi:uncharacterized protein (TIRG00374 family)